MDIRKIRDELYRGKTIYNLPMRVTFYARVSTDKEEQASSLENQIGHFTEYIQTNAHWTYVDGYIDEGISGISTLKRESFNRMIADAKSGRFDFIITKEISRFSRNTLDSIRYTQELLSLGVGVLFQNDNINTLDSDSEFRLVVMAGVAQDEVRKLSERLKFGFKQSIKNGRVLGNDRIYGYNKEKCKLTINQEEAAIVRKIFQLYANDGMGIRRLSQHLYDTEGITSRQGNPFNTTTIKNMILNPKYKGYYCGNRTKSIDYKTKKSVQLDESEWVLYKDENIPAIVSEELWDRANALYKSRGKAVKEAGASYHNSYPYSGKIVCAEHGTSFHRQAFQTSEGKRENWQCKTYRQRGAAACTAPNLRTTDIDHVLLEVFHQLYQDKTWFVEQLLRFIQTASKDLSPQADSREHGEITLIERKKDKLLEMSLEGILTNAEFKARNDALNEQLVLLKQRAKVRREEQKEQRAAPVNLPKVKNTLEHVLNVHSEYTAQLMTCILDKIIVHSMGDRKKAKLEIRLKAGKILDGAYDSEQLCLCYNSS